MEDVLGIGFGPANIALAVALDELAPGLKATFVEASPRACWQPNMMIDRADIQNNPLRDLVTPRNPRSRFSFVNFLHENGRLFRHLNLPDGFPLRKEYAQYVAWVAENVGADVRYGRRVSSIKMVSGSGGRPVVAARTTDGEEFRARSVVLAPGRTPYVPEVFGGIPSPSVVHTADYLPGIAGLSHDYEGTIALVGASQSACEVLLDLMDRFPKARLVNLISGFGYRLKDTSPFSEEVYFPEFVDYYFNAQEAGRELLRTQLRGTNYSAADRDVIDSLYSRIYEEELDGSDRVRLLRNNRVVAARLDKDGHVVLDTVERVTGERDRLRVDRVLLATGYRDLGLGTRQEELPPLLNEVRDLVRINTAGLSVDRDYRVRTADGVAPLYINGLCESTHGFGDAGSFSLLALRSQAIVNSLQTALAGSQPLLAAAQ